MVQLPEEEGKITIFRLHLDGTRGWRRYHRRWRISNQTKYGCQVLKFVFFALISVIWVNLQQMIV